MQKLVCNIYALNLLLKKYLLDISKPCAELLANTFPQCQHITMCIMRNVSCHLANNFTTGSEKSKN